MSDMNGRQIQESRDVNADFPVMTAAQMGDKTLTLANRYTTSEDLDKGVRGVSGFTVPTTRSIDISRSNYLTDPVYLPFSMDVSDYNLDWTLPSGDGSFAWNPSGNKWHAQPGIINPTYKKARAGDTTCTKVVY